MKTIDNIFFVSNWLSFPSRFCFLPMKKKNCAQNFFTFNKDFNERLEKKNLAQNEKKTKFPLIARFSEFSLSPIFTKTKDDSLVLKIIFLSLKHTCVNRVMDQEFVLNVGEKLSTFSSSGNNFLHRIFVFSSNSTIYFRLLEFISHLTWSHGEYFNVFMLL